MPVGSRLVLRGEYDIWRRDELRAELACLDMDGDVILDMTGVTLMDAGSAAMLIALQHRLRENDPKANVVVENAPRIVRRILDLCGASDLFVFTMNR